jgi:uridylate kinase
MYKRVLLKLSGEALLGRDKFGCSFQTIDKLAKSVSYLQQTGVQMGIVIGGGNIIRGSENSTTKNKRIVSDQMGMLATVINSLNIEQSLENNGCKVKVLSAFSCGNFVEIYCPRKADNYLKEGFCLIFAGGTGLPFFSTDTAAALRAIEIGAEILLKATKVDGVYDKDPMKDKKAKKYDHITYNEVLEKSLKVMDLTATALCMDNNLPILVFDIFESDSLKQAVFKEKIGTFVGV